MATNLPVIPGNIPEGFCFSTYQNLLNTFVENMIVQIPGTVALFNYGPNTPTIDNRDKPWIKLNSDGTFAGVFVFVNGDWYTTYPFTTGDVIFFSGAESAVADPFFLCNGQTVTRSWGSFTTPDLRGRFLLSSGQGAGLTNRTVGQTGGEELHTMIQAELVTHQHIQAYVDSTVGHAGSQWGVSTVTASGAPIEHAGASGANQPFPFTSNVGNTTPFNVMGPFYVLAAKCFVKPNN